MNYCFILFLYSFVVIISLYLSSGARVDYTTKSSQIKPMGQPVNASDAETTKRITQGNYEATTTSMLSQRNTFGQTEKSAVTLKNNQIDVQNKQYDTKTTMRITQENRKTTTTSPLSHRNTFGQTEKSGVTQKNNQTRVQNKLCLDEKVNFLRDLSRIVHSADRRKNLTEQRIEKMVTSKATAENRRNLNSLPSTVKFDWKRGNDHSPSTTPLSMTPLSTAKDCWWTGCQLKSSDVMGCKYYNMDELDRSPCTNDTIKEKKTMPGQQQERMRLSSMGGESTCSNSSSGASGSTIMKIRRRVVMIGAARVGKTSIIKQFLYDQFPDRYKETIEELHRGDYELPDGARLTLDILDTSGAYQFPAMRELSISTADAFLLVFCIDREDTWDQVKNFKEQIIEKRGPKIPIVIVGNKCELPERFLPIEITEAIARYDWECGYVECSAKENRNIVQVFKELLNQAKVQYNLSPAVRRRRMSLPSYVENRSGSTKGRYMLKRNSCTVA